MKIETIKTIRFALRFLLNINESIVNNSGDIERIKRAMDDIDVDKRVIADFDKFVSLFYREG